MTMNRRELGRVVASVGMLAAFPPACRAATGSRSRRAGATPAATPGADLLTAIQATLHLHGPVPRAASATWGGSLPAHLTHLMAIVAIAGDIDTAEKTPGALVAAVHDYETRIAPRGTLVTNANRINLPAAPGGSDDASLSTFSAGDRILIVTTVRAGTWVQLLAGPTSDPADAAGADLIAFAATTMPHWGDLTGDTDPITALPTLDDLPAGATVLAPPVVVHDLATG